MKTHLVNFRLLYFVVALCMMCTATTFSPADLYAQNYQTQIDSLYQEAIDNYDMLMLEGAEAALLQAVSIARQHNLSGSSVANAYLMLGIVRHSLRGSDQLVEEAFIHAIESHPETQIDPVYQTPALATLFESARQKARQLPSAQPPEPSPGSPANDDPFAPFNVDITDTTEPSSQQGALQHTPLTRARAGQSLTFETIAPESMPVFRIMLHFRRQGENAYTAIEMKPQNATNFEVTLQGSQVQSAQLDYFIEARDRSGNTIANLASQQNPYAVAIVGATNPIYREQATRPTHHTEHWDDLAEEAFRPQSSGNEGAGFYLLLGGGSDIGYITGGIPTANRHRDVAAGLAPAFAHLMGDMGVAFNRKSHLGLYFRWQVSPAQNFLVVPPESQDPGTGFWNSRQECFGLGIIGDCLLGLKYRWVFTSDSPDFYASFGGGVGRVRNWLQLKHTVSADQELGLCTGKELYTDPAMGDYCFIRDTVRTGWAHLGIGTGMYIPLNSWLDFAADSYLMVLMPDVSINLDITVGLRLKL